MGTKTWLICHWTQSSHNAWWRKTKVIRILIQMYAAIIWVTVERRIKKSGSTLITIGFCYTSEKRPYMCLFFEQWRNSFRTHGKRLTWFLKWPLMKNFASQNSKARCRVWIVRNDLHIAEDETKGTCTKLDGHFAAKLKLLTSCYIRTAVRILRFRSWCVGIRKD